MLRQIARCADMIEMTVREHDCIWSCSKMLFRPTLIDRSRAALDLKSVRTILGYRRRPRYHKRKSKSAAPEVLVERPAYDLTIFKLHCGKLTLKIYTKGERLLRMEAIAHNTQELNCGRSLDKFSSNCLRIKKHPGAVYGCVVLHRSVLHCR
jgi:hypothetical protein